MITADRYHDISCGHRVVGHEGKCRHLHGHNYRIHFKVTPDYDLDKVGRVLDFGVIKSRLCMWLEDNWDHKFLAWLEDPVINAIYYSVPGNTEFQNASEIQESIVWVPFNPTAENMAKYLVEVIGPQQLVDLDCTLQSVVIEETRKCSVSFSKD